MVWGLSPCNTLDLRADHYPIYVWKWLSTYWSVTGQVASLGVVKDACEVKMGLPLSSKAQHSYCSLSGDKLSVRYISTNVLCFRELWECLSRKLSHIHGQWTTISQRGFGMAWQLFLSLLFCHVLRISQPFSSSEQSVEWVEMLKMWWFTALPPLTYHSQLSFSHQ